MYLASSVFSYFNILMIFIKYIILEFEYLVISKCISELVLYFTDIIMTILKQG